MHLPRIDQWGRTVVRPRALPDVALKALEHLRRHPERVTPADEDRITRENDFA
jgi:hypothetical protein